MIIISSFFALALSARAQTWISHDEEPAPETGISSAPDPGLLDAPDLPPPVDPGAPDALARVAAPAAAEEPPVLPVFVALRPNPNDFVAFADGGWDGNWYVGYNNCWIVKLPPVPPGSYQRAYIGAKIGRAKTNRKEDQHFDQTIIPGKIYMAVAPSPAFTTERSFFLTNLEDVPTQPDPTLISNAIGQPGWFWTEVPVEAVSSVQPNYVAIWSSTDGLISASSSPILAAATTMKPADAWLNRSIRGVPPREAATALETRLSRLLPALAIKLAPQNSKKVKVGGLKVEKSDGGTVLQFAVEGENVESAWYEVSYDMLSWTRDGPLLRTPPFAFTLPERLVGARELYVRVAAMDSLGNLGASAPLKITK